MGTATTLVDQRTFVESPRWHEGRIWFSELYAHQVMSAQEDGSDLRVEAAVPGQPSGLGWLPDGRLLVVSMRDQKLMRREADGSLVVHADLSAHAGGFCNDVVVDRRGRAYLGEFGFDLDGGAPMAAASIYRVDPNGAVTEVAKDMWFPNGCVLTDGGVLIVNETFGNRISAFDLTEDGRLVNRRSWAEFGPLPTDALVDQAWPQFAVIPDGLCMDSEGALWIADLASGKLLRLLEGGEVVDQIDPGMMPFGAALGGADGRTMFICAAPNFDVEERKTTRLAEVLHARVGVPCA